MTCNISQQSLDWCEGKVVMPGIRKRLYFIAKSHIAEWPTMTVDPDTGRPTSAALSGNFELEADKYFHHIDILVDKSQLTSEAQGEYPSQTQLNKLAAVHPDVEEDATIGAANFNNTDNVYIVPTMSGKFRVLGNKLYQGKATYAQDLGQGATGTASSTLNVEHTDLIPAPFYTGKIYIADGKYINAATGEEEMDTPATPAATETAEEGGE